MWNFSTASECICLPSDVESKVSIPFQSIAIEQGRPYELLCEADVDINACAWITPAGKTYIFWTGAR